MPVSVLISLAIQKVVDRLLALSPKAVEKCASLQDKVIKFEIQGFDTSFYILVTSKSLEVLTEYEHEVDVTFSGMPSGYIALSKNPTDALFNNEITIKGDFATGKQFSHLIELIEVDIESLFAQMIGKDLAQHFANNIKQKQQHPLSPKIRQFLQDKLEVLPRQQDVRQFADQVHKINLDVERLQQRIQRLMSQSGV